MRKASGFTLIELMIVLMILGAIAAIAWPAYMGNVQKTNRSEAKVELTDVAQRLQKCYTTYGRYDDPGTNACAIYEDLTDGDNYTSKGKGFYKITISHTPGNERNTYELKATAIKSPQTKDTVNGCNEMTLDSVGQMRPTDCW